MKHIIITPVYNEEDYLEIFINSIINQEVRPDKFILVDDNSSDNSASIIKKYSNEFEWVTYIYHPAEKKKSQGAKVIRAFNYGLESISLSKFDIISKIDADLELPPNYLKEVKSVFMNAPEVGIAGGYIFEKMNDKWCEITQASYHIRGALKSYRVESFKRIGGLMPVLGWDGLDEMMIFYEGWNSKILNVGVKHFRPAASDYNPKSLAYKIGFSKYKNGSNFILVLIRSFIRLKKKPYILYSFSYLRGYISAWLKGEEKIVSNDLAKFINRFHYKRIFKSDN